MASTRASERLGIWARRRRGPLGQRGIALFMVLAAIAVLFTVVFEFSYVVNVNQKLANDGMDQVKAHYLAKTGLKLSLLRLKAYQNLKSAMSAMGGAEGGAAAAGMVPKGLLEKIWSFPFVYPIPADLPGLGAVQKEEIAKFTRESGIDGSFTALIESESSKLNLNSMLQQFAPPMPAPTGGAGAGPGTDAGAPGDADTGGGARAADPNAAAAAGQFNPEAARQSVAEYVRAVLERQFEQDPDFAAEYRDFRIDDFVDNLVAWADRTYQRRYIPPREVIEPKGAPFYSLNELRLIEPLDDRLFDVLAPTLTVAPTPGINVNTIGPEVLRALVVGIRDEEVKEFFEFRDSDREDNLFRQEDDFFRYLQQSVSRFRGDAAEVKRYREELRRRNLRIVTEESAFKVTVTATVGKVTRTLEAWVQTTAAGTAGGARPGAPGTPPPAPPAGVPAAVGTGVNPNQPDPGLRITFMRIS